MLAEFLNIFFKSLKLDRSLYKENKYFGEAAIYFAGLIMILDGVAGAVAANTIIKTSVGLSGLTAILTWFIWAVLIYVIGVKIFPDKESKITFKRILIRLPSPGPSSTIFILFGLPNFSHVEIIQIDINSEKRLEIVGAVIKSPFSPNGT